MIGAKRVTAPDGTTWRVGRRWLPDKPVLWRPKKRHAEDGGGWLPDVGLGDVDDAIVIVIAVIGVILLFIVLTTFVFPIIVFGIELLIVALLLVGGIAARLLFRRPWTIRARAIRTRRHLEIATPVTRDAPREPLPHGRPRDAYLARDRALADPAFSERENAIDFAASTHGQIVPGRARNRWNWRTFVTHSP